MGDFDHLCFARVIVGIGIGFGCREGDLRAGVDGRDRSEFIIAGSGPGNLDHQDLIARTKASGRADRQRCIAGRPCCCSGRRRVDRRRATGNRQRTISAPAGIDGRHDGLHCTHSGEVRRRIVCRKCRSIAIRSAPAFVVAGAIQKRPGFVGSSIAVISVGKGKRPDQGSFGVARRD